MSTKTRRRKPQLAIDKTFSINQYNHAYEDAKRGIIPNVAIRTFKKMNPNHKALKPTIAPFTMKDIAKSGVFTKNQAKKLLKASLFSRTPEYDSLRPSYQV